MAGEASEKVQKAVAGMLKDPSQMKPLHFSLAGMRVIPARYAEVGDAITTGKIKLFVGLVAKHPPIFYEAKKNELHIVSDDLTSVFIRAGIVHEATHAIQDMKKLTGSVLDAEAAAFVAQALYARGNGIAPGRRIVDTSDPNNDAVFAHAFLVADVVLGHSKSDRDMAVGGLREAILKVPFYKKADTKKARYDGV